MSSRRRQPESGEAVATVKNMRIGLRPSTPAPVGMSAFAIECVAQDHVLGQPAVETRIRISPTSGSKASGSTTSKINYMGTTSYLADGSATSINVDWNVATTRHQKAQLDLATGGGTARGVPPRGKPV
jgi:hypothetical protein